MNLLPLHEQVVKDNVSLCRQKADMVAFPLHNLSTLFMYYGQANVCE